MPQRKAAVSGDTAAFRESRPEDKPGGLLLDYFQLRNGEVVSVDTRIVHFVKANYDRVFDAAFVNGRNLADFLIPVRLFTKNLDAIATFNHE
jgi:hypothetical protein